MAKALLFLAFLIVCATVPLASAKILQGHIDTYRDFMYLGKFAFDSSGGRMEFAASHVHPTSDRKNGNILITFYNDQKGKDWYWNDIWKSDMSCSEKVANQHPSYKDGQNITITEGQLSFNFAPGSRPHYWYMAASDCVLEEDETLRLHVKIHWTNGKSSWYREFSYEDQDLLTLYLVFAIIWCIGIFGVALGAFLLIRKDQYAFVVKLFDTAVVFFTIALLCYLTHYAVYTSNGHGVPALLISAECLDMFTTLMFIGVLLLVAKGAALDTIDLMEIKFDLLITFCFYTLYIAFWMWQVIYPYVTPQSNAYKWNCTPGVIMLVIRGGMYLYFLYVIAMNFLQEKQVERKYFLLVFGTVFSIYFLYLPFMVAVFEGVKPFYRWKAILGISLSIQTIAFGFMCFLQWPSKLAKLFHLDANRLVNPADNDDEDSLSPYGTL